MYLKIKVFPDFKKEAVERIDDERLKVYVAVPAKEGRANRRMITLLSEYLDVRPSAFRIISGHQRQNKIIEYQGNLPNEKPLE